MQNKKRLFALLMCVGLVLTLFVSSTYIVSNAGHDCIGHGCDVCEHIAEARALLQSFALLGLLVALLFMADLLRRHFSVADGIRLPAQGTLVGWKVRLNN